MGGQRYSDRVLQWARAVNGTFTLDEVMQYLDLTSKQARQALRRFVNEGQFKQLSSNEWHIIDHDKDTVDTGAREAQEKARAAARAIKPAMFEQVDTLASGALLLRAETGTLYRAELEEL